MRMKLNKLLIPIALLFLAMSALAQGTLNTEPALALGHPPGISPLSPKSSQANLVEGRELNRPQSVAVDISSGAVYVADTGNNRVLAWRDARNFASGSFADLVIGQADLFSTFNGGPGTSVLSGLKQPMGVAVDADGNLYVVDAGNNRILRYPKPFEQQQTPKLADLVIGQPTMSTNQPNIGGLSATTIKLTAYHSVHRSALAFDAEGNLWFSDAGNNRILRYPASRLGQGASHGPAADIVLGQPNFTTNTALGLKASNRQVKTGHNAPSGLALDASGHLFVADALSRVLVYEPPFATGKAASRVMGIVVAQQGDPPPPVINDHSLGFILGSKWFPPEGVFTIGDVPFVLDTSANRILRYAPFSEWAPEDPEHISPAARAVIGQDSLNSDAPVQNRGRVEPGPDTLASPVAATAAFGMVFVTDSDNNRLLVFPDLTNGGTDSKAGRVLGQADFPHRSPNLTEGREFFFTSNAGTAAGIAIDRNSDPPHLYVADMNNHRVLCFRDVRRVRNGTRADLVLGQVDFSRTLINSPSNKASERNNTGLFFPVAVAVDAAGNVYVADSGNARVLRFPKPFDQPAGGKQEADLVLGQQDFNTRITDATSVTMASPAGLLFAPDGKLLVSDAVHNRVLLFEPPFTSGKAASRVFGQPDFNTIDAGSEPNRMKGPNGLGIDAGYRLYVCDTNNNRVMIFSDIRAPVGDPNAALMITGLRNPRDVYVSPTTGKAWVTDTNKNYLRQYPKYETMAISGATPILNIVESGPLAVDEDPFGNLFVADALNRVVAYFPALGVVNAASYLPRDPKDPNKIYIPGKVAPGMISSLFFLEPKQIETKSFNELPNPLPLPKELGDIQVLVDGKPVCLYFVSSGQINFLMPNDAPTSGFVQVVVVRPSTLQILATNFVPADVASPAFFTRPPTGTGQAAALNLRDGTVAATINSAENPAKPGEWVSLFGTGAGHVEGAPPDGEPASGLTPTPVAPLLFVHSDWLPAGDVNYSGLAPDLVGVWQVNFKLPDNLPDGNVFVVAIIYGRPTGDPNLPQGHKIVTTVAVKR